MIFLTHSSEKSYWDENLSTYEGKLPAIHIADIETSLDFISSYDNNYEGDYKNYIAYHWSAIAYGAYTVEEYGQIEAQIQEDKSEAYIPSMETEFYHLRFQFLAKLLFHELID